MDVSIEPPSVGIQLGDSKFRETEGNRLRPRQAGPRPSTPTLGSIPSSQQQPSLSPSVSQEPAGAGAGWPLPSQPAAQALPVQQQQQQPQSVQQVAGDPAMQAMLAGLPSDVQSVLEQAMKAGQPLPPRVLQVLQKSTSGLRSRHSEVPPCLILISRVTSRATSGFFL